MIGSRRRAGVVIVCCITTISLAALAGRFDVDQVAVLVHTCSPARGHDDRRVHLVDDRRAVEPGARPQLRSIEDRRVGEVLELVEVDAALGAKCLRGRSMSSTIGELRSARASQRSDTGVDDLDGGHIWRQAVAELALVGLAVPLGEVCDRGRIGGRRRQPEVQVRGLTVVAQVD